MEKRKKTELDFCFVSIYWNKNIIDFWGFLEMKSKLHIGNWKIVVINQATLWIIVSFQDLVIQWLYHDIIEWSNRQSTNMKKHLVELTYNCQINFTILSLCYFEIHTTSINSCIAIPSILHCQFTRLFFKQKVCPIREHRLVRPSFGCLEVSISYIHAVSNEMRKIKLRTLECLFIFASDKSDSASFIMPCFVS